MPDCPLCKQTHPPSCGLRLFNSDNECPICLEKNPEMIALPCGHQFCSKDLERLGFRQQSTPPVERISLPPRQPIYVPPDRRQRATPPLSEYLRHVASRRGRRVSRAARRSRTVNRSGIRRRCGWCGHIGHTQRKCIAHRIQCGCITFKRTRHKQLYKQKPLCNICGKRGHKYTTCHIVVSRS